MRDILVLQMITCTIHVRFQPPRISVPIMRLNITCFAWVVLLFKEFISQLSLSYLDALIKQSWLYLFDSFCTCHHTIGPHLYPQFLQTRSPNFFVLKKTIISQETLRRNFRMLTCGKVVSDFWIWRKLKGLIFLGNFKILTNIGGVIENFPSISFRLNFESRFRLRLVQLIK